MATVSEYEFLRKYAPKIDFSIETTSLGILHLGEGLRDAGLLLAFHDRETRGKPGKPFRHLEVLKRSAIILTVTAWETFIESTIRSRFRELIYAAKSPNDVNGAFSHVAQSWLQRQRGNGAPNPAELKDWVGDEWKRTLARQLERDIEGLNTPNSENIRNLTRRYLAIDVTKGWAIGKRDAATVAKELDDLIGLRGNLTHHGRQFMSKRAEVYRESVVSGILLIQVLGKRTETTIWGKQGQWAGKKVIA